MKNLGKAIEASTGLCFITVGIAIVTVIGIIEGIAYLLSSIPQDFWTNYRELCVVYGPLAIAVPICSGVILVGIVILLKEKLTPRKTPEEVVKK